MIAAEAVPNEMIADHLLDAKRSGVLVAVDQKPTPLGTEFARFSECGAFSMGLGEVPEDNWLVSTIRSRVYPGGCEALHAALLKFDNTGLLPQGISYFRYWHGYSVITRPSLSLTGVGGTRWIAFTWLAVTIGAMCAAVARAFGGVATALLVGPALLTTDLVLGGFSAFLAIGASTAWIGGWMTFGAVARKPEWRTAGLSAAIAGAFSAYLDAMTTMPGAFALTVTGATLGVYAAHSGPLPRDAWQLVTAAAVGWGAGLAWMWASKWIFAAAVLGIHAVVDDIESQIQFRLSGGSHGVSESRMRGLTTNLGEWWEKPLTPWVVIGILAAILVAALRRRHVGVSILPVALFVVLVAVAVLGWYPALNNHSQIHPTIVYKSLPIAFGGAASVAYVALCRQTKRAWPTLGRLHRACRRPESLSPGEADVEQSQ